MIINHKYKFIFVKTRKTAGTSIEIALSKFCDNNDIITPITKEDEPKRTELGFNGPQNYHLPLHNYGKLDWLRLLGKAKRKQFYNHVDAPVIRDSVGEEIWNSYFKFCFERNPFDKAISRYFWSARDPRPKIDEYLNSAPVALLSNWNIYTINDHIAMDFVGRYEKISEHLTLITERLKLPEKLTLPRAKGSYRKTRDHYSTVLGPGARTRIETVCAKEINAFDYRWNEDQAC